MDLYELIQTDVEAIVADFKARAADGRIDLGDAWALFQEGAAAFMKLVEQLGDFSGPDKKAAVLQALGLFYDRVLAPIDIPWVPNFIENSVVDPLLRRVFLAMAGGSVDYLAKLFNLVGWNDPPAPTPLPTPTPGPTPDPTPDPNTILVPPLVTAIPPGEAGTPLTPASPSPHSPHLGEGEG